ncbi:TPA: glycosyltransferase family 2 protein, partial [Vibrio cholerae]
MKSCSVVITTKNRIDFLLRAIDSISNCDVEFLDIVVVNDGGDT